MKSGLILGIVFALVIHGAVILLGGAVLPHKADYTSVQKVDLVGSAEVRDEKKKDKPEEIQKKTDNMQADTDTPPDANQIVDKIELSAAASAPKLDAASLGAIEAALNGGGGGGGDFAGGMDFASGGRIGGAGKIGVDNTVDNAFSMTEIDQKPRTVFQSSPVYPPGMKTAEGVVILIFIVDANGRVTNARVEKASHPQFERPALDAVRQWRFEAAVKGGQRVACKMRVPIRFQPR